MAKAVKLSDIAEKVGVSTVTVSKALSDKSGVGEEMRSRIKEVAREMGYQPVSAGKKEPAARTGNIGVLIPEGFLDKVNSFYWDMYQMVVKAAASREYYCILEIVEREEEVNLSMPKILSDEKVDGVILIGQPDSAYSDFLWRESPRPLMYMDFYEASKGYDTIISDGFYGMYLLTDYLIQNGHEKIAFVGTLLSTSSITDRYFGYLKAMMEHGFLVPEEWVIRDRDAARGHWAYDTIQLPAHMPTAFACNSDYTADILMRCLEDAGYQVPQDVSVVGFDNCEWDKFIKVPITSYDVMKDRMAELAVKNLVRKINQEPCVSGVQIVAGSLVEKNSVKKLG